MKTLEESIAEHPFFDGMSKAHVALMSKGAGQRLFAADEVLFGEGEPANQFYLLETGRVSLESYIAKGKMQPLETITAGDVVGWSWLFPPFVWQFQARALEPTSAIVLDGGHLLVVSEENPLFACELMKRLSRVMIHRLQTTRNELIKEKALHLDNTE